MIQALRLHAPGQLLLHQEADPIPASDEELVRVSAVGICGSDLHWFNEAGIGDAHIAHPLILGHEFAGVVESGPLRGRLVAVDPAVPCGRCEWCLTGRQNLCVNMHFAGHGEMDGALRTLLAWPAANLYPLPEPLDALDGAMLEPLGVALYALDLSPLRAGMSVGVFGCGPIGLLIIQLLRASGASHIIATDRLPHRLEAAESCGADRTFLVEDTTDHAAIWAAAGQRGLDIAFEAAGDADALEAAVQAARPGGQVTVVGIPSDDRYAFTASSARRKELTVRIVRRMNHVYPRTIELAAAHRVNLHSLITHRFPLDQAPQAFQLASQREGLKIVIEP